MEKISQRLIIDNGFWKVFQAFWSMHNEQESDVIVTQRSEGGGAVMVVPITSAGNIVYLREFRFGPEEYVYNFPAGGVEQEDDEDAIRRELVEETGYMGGAIIPLGVYNLGNYTFGKGKIFLMRDCKKVSEKSLRDIEDITVFETSIPEFEAMTERNEIQCVFTALAFHLAKAKTHNFTQF